MACALLPPRRGVGARPVRGEPPARRARPPCPGTQFRVKPALTQFVWSARLTYHSARRGFYNPWMEDYRYPIVRRLVPKWFFEIVVHIFAVVIAQPLLLLTLCFPVRAMLLPAAQLSHGPFPSLHVTLNAFRPLWATARAHGIPLDTPVLHAGDALAVLVALGAVFMQKKTDDAMYAYQEAKHAAINAKRQPRAAEEGVPQPADVPPEFFPGFPTTGIHSVVRHANFTGEQTFWLAQGLLGLGAGPTAPRVGSCLLPPFLVRWWDDGADGSSAASSSLARRSPSGSRRTA